MMVRDATRQDDLDSRKILVPARGSSQRLNSPVCFDRRIQHNGVLGER